MKLHDIVEMVEVILRVPTYAFMVGSLNPSGNLTSRISRLKGDPVAAAINSTSFSFMAAIAWQRSSIRISLCLLGATSEIAHSIYVFIIALLSWDNTCLISCSFNLRVRHRSLFGASALILRQYLFMKLLIQSTRSSPCSLWSSHSHLETIPV